jgi:hypothetical protein
MQKMEGQYSVDSWATTLKRADYWTDKALRPVKGLLPEATAALIYVEKMASIRIVPYAPVAFIAIPFTSIRAQRDLLAIPHEVGHHVYWNGKLDGGGWLREALVHLLEQQSERPAWIKRWVEEVFADIFGCLIAGPLIALDFQDLQLQNSQQGFVEDDGEHPTPVLRPYVYTKVLELQGSEGWAKRLNSVWEWQLGRRENPNVIKIREPQGTHEVSLEEACEKLSALVELIYEFLKPKICEVDAAWRKYSEIGAPPDQDPELPKSEIDRRLYDVWDADESASENYDPILRLQPLPDPPENLWIVWEERVPRTGESGWLNKGFADGWLWRWLSKRLHTRR